MTSSGRRIGSRGVRRRGTRSTAPGPTAIKATARCDDAATGPEVLEFGDAFVLAAGTRRTHPGLTLRYEDLVGSPVEQTGRVCVFLGVAPEAEMLEYGTASARAGEFVRDIGDWSTKIRRGRIQAGRPLPADEDVPVSVRGLAEAWGYLPTAA